MVNPRALSASLPDIPRWIYAHALLATADAVVTSEENGRSFVVLSARYALACVVGEPPTSLLRTAAEGFPPDVRVLGPPESGAATEAGLTGWHRSVAVVHTLGPSGLTVGAEPGPMQLLRLREAAGLTGWPQELAEELSVAPPDALAAVAFVAGAPASICYAAFETDFLWDVSIEAVERFRRHGLAETCAVALIREMHRRGKAPVWGAEQHNVPSMRLARKLGFAEVDRLVLFSPP